jgi:hypothetical protein
MHQHKLSPLLFLLTLLDFSSLLPIQQLLLPRFQPPQLFKLSKRKHKPHKLKPLKHKPHKLKPLKHKLPKPLQLLRPRLLLASFLGPKHSPGPTASWILRRQLYPLACSSLPLTQQLLLKSLLPPQLFKPPLLLIQFQLLQSKLKSKPLQSRPLQFKLNLKLKPKLLQFKPLLKLNLSLFPSVFPAFSSLLPTQLLPLLLLQLSKLHL